MSQIKTATQEDFERLAWLLCSRPRWLRGETIVDWAIEVFVGYLEEEPSVEALTCDLPVTDISIFEIHGE